MSYYHCGACRTVHPTTTHCTQRHAWTQLPGVTTRNEALAKAEQDELPLFRPER